jgi:hypothetical protein
LVEHTTENRSVDSSILSLATTSRSHLAEDHDRNSPTGQVLLVANVSISREEQLKSGGFGCVEKLAVPERVPAVRAGFLYDITDQHARDTLGVPFRYPEWTDRAVGLCHQRLVCRG